MARPPLEIVHVGSACRDIDPSDPRGWRLGGGVTYAALTTARLGLRTAAIVGADAEAAGSSELDTLRQAGAEVLVVPLDEGPVFHNVETPAGRVQTCIQRGVPLPIPSIPVGWLAAAGWSIVPVADEIPDAWAAVIPQGAYVSVAWQGFLRELRAGQRVVRRAPRPSPILHRADLVGVSHQDVPRETPVAALCDAAPSGRRPADHPRGVRRAARGGRAGRAGGDGALPADRDERRARPDRCRRHLPRGPPVDRPAPGDRRASAGTPPRGPAVRGRCRVAGRRGARPGRRAGPRRSPRPPGAGADPPGGAARPSLTRWAWSSPRTRARRGGDPAAAVPRVSRSTPAAAAIAGRGCAGPPRAAVPAVRAGRRRSVAASPAAAADSAPRGSRRRCSRSLASSIAATTAVRPGPAASADQASAASSQRPRRRRRCARSAAMRSSDQGAAKAAVRGFAGPAEIADLAPPKSAATLGDHHGSSRTAAVGRVGAAGRRCGVGRRARQRGVEAAERLVEPAYPGEGTGEAGEIARRRRPTGILGGVPRVEDGEQPRQRADVLVVVADDRRERLGRATTQEPEVAAGDLPALDVAVAVHPEQSRLHGSQPCVLEAMAEQPTDDREQVEMAGVDRGGAAVHPVAGHEQGPVEAATVVGHEPGVVRQVRRDGLEQGRLLAVVGEQQLDLPEGVADPPAEADEERHGPGRRGQPRRLRVEADQRHVRGRLPGERCQPLPVERDRPDGDLAANDGPVRRSHDLAVDGAGQPLGEDVPVDPGVRERPALVEVEVPGRSPRRRPVALEPPDEPLVAVGARRVIPRRPRRPGGRRRRRWRPGRRAAGARAVGHRRPARGAVRCRPDSRRRSRSRR